MPVLETKSNRVRAELENLPEVEYPPEVVERWVKEAEVARLQLAAGELPTMAEFAAKRANLTGTGQDKVEIVKSLFGIIPNSGATLAELREERLARTA